jgi:DNA-directed RNA polymerase specialized sigma24 family protein
MVAMREEVAAVEKALRALPWKEREALLTYVRSEGLATVEETAARLGIAKASVAVYRQRARERIREALRTGSSGGFSWRSGTRTRS